MKNSILKLLFVFGYNKLIFKLISIYEKVKVIKYEKECSCKINFVSQGNGGLVIAGKLENFYIDSTSHLKSGTFIECSGGVSIGRYFHTGRGLTIFSVTHNYERATMIPYDEVSIDKPVIIKDFVWCGANVTILPGITIGEGVVIGAGSVVTKNVPSYAIIGGNPAKIIKYRDEEKFIELKKDGQWF